MKTTLGIITSLLLSSAAFAGNAAPDFTGAAPRPHIDKSLVASSGTAPIEPGDVLQFRSDEAILTTSGYSQVDRAALWLKVHPKDNIVIEGQADHPGTEPYNSDLSMLRAEAVRKRLMSQGISRKRIIMVASGEKDQLLSPADRRVRMYATKLSPQAIYAMTAEQARNAPAVEQTARR
ncbi:MAG TPA: OmpA family protein [Kofleriaceae bacterium]|nr:OmpA family protein [Kofleriaceae bacterium]